MKKNARYIFGTLIFLLLSNPGFSQIKRVWTVDDSEKIKKEDLNNPLATDPSNSVWKNRSINVFGARNEMVAFQIIIQSDYKGAGNVNVVISDFKKGSSLIKGSETGSSDPYDYRGRNCELFTEHYLNITKRSPPAWFFAATAPPPDYYTGWVPDCLIPFSAPSGKGGAPFSIDGNNNQGVWVDIYIPRDASAGVYKGKTIITQENKVVITLPITLRVYDFTLPDSIHLKSMFAIRSFAGRHGVKSGSPEYYDLEGKYFQMAHRHRLDLVRGANNLREMTDHYKKYLTGELYSAYNGYEGPGEKTGNTTFSITGFPEEYGGSLKNMNEENWRKGSDAWENWFLKNAPGVERHRYLFPDEPAWKGPDGAKGTGSMDTIRMQGKWTHENPGPGRNIPSLVTNNIISSLSGYIDFWSVSTEGAMKINPLELAYEKKQGNKFGIYNGYRPGMGAVITDADAVDFRVMPWISWKYDVDQYFYWQTTFWGKINVFANPLTYEERINGDGTFFYPGQDKIYPEEDRNLKGPLSSIRMKNWRRGEQDYEYLWLAKKSGLDKQLNEIVNHCVPVALWEADPKGNVSWSSRGNDFERYRKQLAELISSKSQIRIKK